MAAGYALAVDLGTSNTVAVLRAPDGRTRPVLFDGQPVLPSAVYLDAAGAYHVGWDAARLGQADPARLEPNPKRRIDEPSILLGERETWTADLLAAVLHEVGRAAVAAAGGLPPAVLTYPASWGASRRDVLVQAVARAGWPPVGRGTTLVPEPVAAARYFADVLRRPVPVGGSLAVFDFGGGTLDLAVVRNEGVGEDGRGRFVVAGAGGVAELGGLDLDAALVEHLGAGIRASDAAAWAAIEEPATTAQLRARRRFWDDVRGAKEMLSRAALAPVAVPGIDQAAHLTRDELEAVIRPLLARGVREAAIVIDRCGLRPDQLAGLFLVGGSSRVPLVARLLHHELGIAPTVLEQPELPVAEGALLEPARAGRDADLAGPVGSGHAPGGGAAGSGHAPGGGAAGSGHAPGGGAASNGHVPGGGSAGSGHAPGAGSAGDGGWVPVGSAPALVGADEPPGGPVPEFTPTVPDVVPSPDGAAAAGPRGPVYGGGGSAPQQTRPLPDGHEAAPLAAVGNPAPAGPAAHFPGVREAPAGTAAQRAPSGPGSTAGPAAWAPGSPAGPAGWASGPPAGSPAWAPGSPAGDGGGGWSGGGGAVRVPPTPEAPAARRRNPLIWVAAAVAVVVVVGAGAVVAWWWNRGPAAIDFRSFTGATTVAAPGMTATGWVDTAVVGDRAYLAFAKEDTSLEVVAVEVDGGKELWRSTAAGTAERWQGIAAVGDGVAVFTEEDPGTDVRTMTVIRGADASWRRQLLADDLVYLFESTVVVSQPGEARIIGLEPRSGEHRWELPNKLDQPTNNAHATVVVATVPDDHAGAADVAGRSFAAYRGADARIVAIGADRSARVIDVQSGDVVKERADVADANDLMLAHNGRLIIGANDDGYRLSSYDLATMGEPVSVYTQTGRGWDAEKLTPCGPDRVCLIEKDGYDQDTAAVVAVDLKKPGRVWDAPAAGADRLVPVGDAVLAVQTNNPPTAVLADGDGRRTLTGVPARVDGANLLLFADTPSDYVSDVPVAGVSLGADEPVQLGPLAGMRAGRCSWDSAVIACAGKDGFVLQRFAD
ncbi:Hsp70 family protein [Spirilliplanes yamanashiensis]|uniref:Uncharacterized protein n=1 Tax=Spirilliplanes yamanashiensis TaxID=42233 RepID=A0A8J3Y6F2_9ACTN|nr:Hsp70 family protein [Spirilliplanes yamanashiensis]MDP9814518.1 hypothetical protein [Spirilliplanes yamanashiensis]GIJ02170.1 hypothetical protein Sya03_15220 [Spirilliplanes yamanashiensis]